MGEKLAGTGWLFVGLTAALGVWSGVVDPLGDALNDVLPLAWQRAALGVLVFVACSALYFRSHWAATLGALADRGPGGAVAARRVEEAAADLARSAHVIGDNLVEVEGHVQDRAAALYLDGAKAHADKLSQVAIRLRNTANEISGSK